MSTDDTEWDDTADEQFVQRDHIPPDSRDEFDFRSIFRFFRGHPLGDIDDKHVAALHATYSDAENVISVTDVNGYKVTIFGLEALGCSKEAEENAGCISIRDTVWVKLPDGRTFGIVSAYCVAELRFNLNLMKRSHPIRAVQNFFHDSKRLFRMVASQTRVCSEIQTRTWGETQRLGEHDSFDITRCQESKRYHLTEDFFARDFQAIVDQIVRTPRQNRYHDNENRLARCLLDERRWPIQKKGGYWQGDDYYTILELGAFGDVGQIELAAAASNRVHAALDLGQTHADDMGRDDMAMLAGLLSIMMHLDLPRGSVPDEDRPSICCKQVQRNSSRPWLLRPG